MSRMPSNVTKQQVSEFVHGYLACARDAGLKPTKEDSLLEALRKRWPEENPINLAGHLGQVIVELEQQGNLTKFPAGQH